MRITGNSQHSISFICVYHRGWARKTGLGPGPPRGSVPPLWHARDTTHSASILPSFHCRCEQTCWPSSIVTSRLYKISGSHLCISCEHSWWRNHLSPFWQVMPEWDSHNRIIFMTWLSCMLCRWYFLQNVDKSRSFDLSHLNRFKGLLKEWRRKNFTSKVGWMVCTTCCMTSCPNSDRPWHARNM